MSYRIEREEHTARHDFLLLVDERGMEVRIQVEHMPQEDLFDLVFHNQYGDEILRVSGNKVQELARILAKAVL